MRSNAFGVSTGSATLSALITCVLVSLLAVSPTAAQTTAASLTGTVKDTTGSVLPGATVVVVSAATTAVAWQGVTDAGGNYLAPSLPVGTYDVTVSLQGFKSIATRGIRLEISQRARLDAELSVGGVDETVTVVGEAAAVLETEDSSIGLVINTSQVQGLPLPSRNVLNLLTWRAASRAAGPPPGSIHRSSPSTAAAR